MVYLSVSDVQSAVVTAKYMTGCHQRQRLMARPACRCSVDVQDIDELNILQAALKAMEGAAAALPGPPPDFLLIDGTQRPKAFPLQNCQTVVKGDTKSTVIAAASILAKVRFSSSGKEALHARHAYCQADTRKRLERLPLATCKTCKVACFCFGFSLIIHAHQAWLSQTRYRT